MEHVNLIGKWYLDKIIIFSVLLILVIIGIYCYFCSFRIQRFIALPLINSVTIFSISWGLLHIPFIRKLDPLFWYFFLIIGSIVGLICGIWINKKFLQIKLKIISLRFLVMYICICAGFAIGICLDFLLFLIFESLSIKALELPLGIYFYIIFTILLLLGGYGGAILGSILGNIEIQGKKEVRVRP
ncbi:MAG: hypothetical protein AB1567_03065 [bacterium]